MTHFFEAKLQAEYSFAHKTVKLFDVRNLFDVGTTFGGFFFHR